MLLNGTCGGILSAQHDEIRQGRALQAGRIFDTALLLGIQARFDAGDLSRLSLLLQVYGHAGFRCAKCAADGR